MVDATPRKSNGRASLASYEEPAPCDEPAPATRVVLDGHDLYIVAEDPPDGGSEDRGRRVGTVHLEGRHYAVYCGHQHEDGGGDLLDRLTPRELEISCLIAAGEVNKSIARRLGISPFTVGAHINRIFCKTGVRSRAALSAQVVHRLGKVPV